MEELTGDRDRFLRYNNYDLKHLEAAANGNARAGMPCIVHNVTADRRSNRPKALTAMQVIKELS